MGKCLRNHIKVYEKTKIPKIDELFSPLCQLQLSISQNRPVQLVSCFVAGFVRVLKVLEFYFAIFQALKVLEKTDFFKKSP